MLKVVLVLLVLVVLTLGKEARVEEFRSKPIREKARVVSDTHSPREIRLRAEGRDSNKPFSLCSFPTRHLLTVSDVLIEPQTVKVGESVKVSVIGNLKKEITGGAVDVSVSYGIIPIKEDKSQVCDKIQCPIKEGPFKHTEVVPVPLGTPNGKFTISYEVFSQDEERVTCVEFDLYVSS